MTRLLLALLLVAGCAAPSPQAADFDERRPRIGDLLAGGPTAAAAIRQAFGPVRARGGAEGDVLTLTGGVWVPAAAAAGSGDITAVVAGDDLSGGATDGSAELDVTSTLATVTARGNVATAGVGLNGVTPATGHLALGSSTSFVQASTQVVGVKNNAATKNAFLLQPQTGRIMPGCATAELMGDGFWERYAITCSDASSAITCEVEGLRWRANTSGSTGGEAQFSTASNVRVLATQSKFYAKFMVALPVTTNVRFFCGFTAATPSVMVSADDPNDQHVGLSFSSGRDTNWQWSRDNAGGSAHTVTDTGVPVDTAIHFVVLDWTSTASVTVTLQDANGATLHTATYTTNLPDGDAELQPVVGVETLADEAKSYDFYLLEAAPR